MKKLILSLLLALMAVAEAGAQSSGTVPSVVITPSSATYSSAGGQVRFDVILNWPTGTVDSPTIPSLRINPPGSEWRYLGVGGTNIPEIVPNVGDSTTPSLPDTGFGFSWYSNPPASGYASFSFVLSYPPNLTSNPIIGVSANYQQGGTKTIPSQNISLSLQTSTGLAPVVNSAKTASGSLVDPVSYQITASEGPTFFTAIGLPDGLALNVVSGLISGTPKRAGVFNVTLNASNSIGTSAPYVVAITIAGAPVISVQPRSQAFATGGKIILLVAATGASPLAYQWKKGTAALSNGGRISGATTSALEISSAQADDAGDYSVVVSNGISPDASSSVARVAIVDAQFGATHALVGAGYSPGSTVTVTNTLNYTGTLDALYWRVELPAGWVYVSSVDTGSPSTFPSATDTDNFVEWIWSTPLPSGSSFTYTVMAAASTSGVVGITSFVEYTVAGSAVQMFARPDPLSVDQVSFHSADYGQNFLIEGQELARALLRIRRAPVRRLLLLRRIIRRTQTRTERSRVKSWLVSSLCITPALIPDLPSTEPVHTK